MAENNAPGDVVQLKSGGPEMTALRKTEFGEWLCCWFAGAELKEMLFPATALDRIR